MFGAKFSFRETAEFYGEKKAKLQFSIPRWNDVVKIV